MCADPGHIRKHLQHPFQADVLIGLGAELARIGINGAEPDVGVGHMNHEDTDPSRGRPPDGLDAPGCIDEVCAPGHAVLPKT